MKLTGSLQIFVATACLAATTASAAVQATSDTAPPMVDANETLLLKSLEAVQSQRLDGAIQTIESLVQDNPKFKLAHLIYGDLLLAKAGPITDFGGGLINSEDNALAGLRNEAHKRWQHHVAKHDADTLVPAYLLQLDDDIDRAVVVDLKKSRFYLYENKPGATPKLIADYYISIGKNGAIKEREGDKRTPIGVYFITEFKGPESLPDFYGSGAFPIDYPNVWDKRQRKTGYGIWLHGTPTNTYSRPPRASDGCITLSNSDLDAVIPLLTPGETPVIVAEEIEWVDPKQQASVQLSFERQLEQWRNDWQSLDTDLYLSHYSDDFKAGRSDLKRWSKQKRRVNSRKSFIEVELDNVNMFAYPGNGDLRVVTFDQVYRSSNYESTSKKQQYWQRDTDGTWRIVYEGPAS